MSAKKIRTVLAVDDSRTDLSVLKMHLEKMGVNVLEASDGRAGINIAVDQEPDLIMLDVMMPDIDGFEVCKKLKAEPRTSNIPIIFVSSRDKPCDKIEGLKIGAIDYITKPYDEGELKARVENVFRTLELEEKLFALAHTDDLTGLPNRRGFFDALQREMFDVSLVHKSLSLMMIDVDHIKEINNNYGHIEGDKILVEIANIIEENVSSRDTAARIGGEEFAILIPIANDDRSLRIAESLHNAINSRRWKIGDTQVSVTVSISIGLACSDSCDSLELIRNADHALCAAKKRGGDCTEVHSSEHVVAERL